MPITIADKTYYARRLFLNLENYGVHIWVDDNGELMKVESPIQGLTAVRTDYEGFEITDPATPKYQPSDKLVYNSVKFPAGDYELAGTLSFPLDTQGPKPCIVFINDTGPQDRHGFVPKIDLYIGTGELLDAISEAGFAVLRYDEPGIGESGGEYGLSMLSTTEADVNAALDYLSTRPDIDSGKLALIGHGEGAIVAMRIAAKRPEIRAIALLAPSAIPLDELAIWQTKRRLSMQGQPDDAWEKDPVVVVIEKARTTEDRWTLIGHKPVYLDIFREMIAADPQTDISKVKVPVYIAECGRDFQLPKGQGDLLSRAAESGGNESVHYRVFRNLDHFFRQGTGELSDYSDETKPIDEKFLGDLSTWLQEVLK